MYWERSSTPARTCRRRSFSAKPMTTVSCRASASAACWAARNQGKAEVEHSERQLGCSGAVTRQHPARLWSAEAGAGSVRPHAKAWALCPLTPVCKCGSQWTSSSNLKPTPL